MSEMIERMAERMEARFKAVVAESAGEPFEATKVALPDRSIFRGYALAALDALGAPTMDMLEHAKPYMDSWSSNVAWWGAMIEKAAGR